MLLLHCRIYTKLFCKYFGNHTSLRSCFKCKKNMRMDPSPSWKCFGSETSRLGKYIGKWKSCSEMTKVGKCLVGKHLGTLSSTDLWADYLTYCTVTLNMILVYKNDYEEAPLYCQSFLVGHQGWKVSETSYSALVFFSWFPTNKFEFTGWYGVNWMFCSEDIR